MPYFEIQDFRAGMDTRRMAVLSVPGSLLSLVNGHINRGGEIEKRLAFVEQVTLPTNTFGLTAVGGTLYTFGSASPGSVTLPAGSPPNLVYQQLAHPSSAGMAKIIQVSAFAGLPYVIAQYEDGAIYHFYNGTRHTEFLEARARASFNITGGTTGGVSATASFTVTGGVNTPGDQVTSIRAGTLAILTQPIQHNGSNTSTAAAIAAAINAFVGNPDFTAVASGATVTITAVTPGIQFNGLALIINRTGGFTVGSVVNMAGGVDNAITNITVDGVDIIGVSIKHTGNNDTTAAAVAAQINEFQSAPEYRALAVGNKVNVIIQSAGAANNGKSMVITKTGNVTTNVGSVTLADGANLVTTPAGSETYLPGEYGKPAKSKMYTTAGSLLHFSGIEAPLEANEAAKEAGFINLANNAEGSERLTAIANYQQNLAIFSERTVQVWFVDVTVAGNQQLQVLNNTGAISPRSVTEIGDSDVFYLSESGIRSLRARNTTNAAFATDIGNPIDTLVLEDINTDRLAVRESRAVLEPRDGRYILAVGNKCYVFSYFPASQVSAWSIYEPGFEVSDWAIVGRRLYCRGGDQKLYLLGGIDGTTYDNTPVVAYVPYIDGKQPATKKSFTGIDLACEGLWQVEIATDPNDQTALETIAYIEETTFAKGNAAFQAQSTHLAVKLTSQNSGYARVGSMLLHFEGGDAG
jgi:putative flippase GtrA